MSTLSREIYNRLNRRQGITVYNEAHYRRKVEEMVAAIKADPMSRVALPSLALFTAVGDSPFFRNTLSEVQWEQLLDICNTLKVRQESMLSNGPFAEMAQVLYYAARVRA